MDRLEEQIAEWRSYVVASPALVANEVDELETHLRDQMDELIAAGLRPDEAFLVAVRRLGAVDALTHEFAREHHGRLWMQLVPGGADEVTGTSEGWRPAIAFAVAAAVAVHVARLLAGFPEAGSEWLLRNATLLVLPFLAGYLAHRRQLDVRGWLWTVAPFGAAAILVNVFPYRPGSATELLVAAHLPVALWFAVAYPYTGGVVRSHGRRMDFVRFTGEWLIYYVLIALGGGVLMGLTTAILTPIGSELAELVAVWVLPAGAAGAVIVAAWLVESKQRVVENMAPVLTLLFTPLFAVMLTLAVVTYAASGAVGTFDRELLGVFDALLVVVLGLVVYSLSARDPSRPAGLMDRVQLVAIASALLLDLMVLGSMLARVGELGFTPNRAAALGLNVVLLVNLVVAAWRSLGFVRGRRPVQDLERWQTAYLPVLATWAAVVVVAFPPLFGFG